MVKRILVPLDGSSTSERGLQQALELARELKTAPHFILLHLVEHPVALPEAGDGYDVGVILAGLRRQGTALLAKALARCQEAGCTAETEVLDADGRIATNVVERAQARACDLVVMGTHGRRGPSRWVLGSDAELVVRLSPVPVLLVRARGE